MWLIAFKTNLEKKLYSKNKNKMYFLFNQIFI